VHTHTLLLGLFSLLLTALPAIAPALSYRSCVIDAPMARMLASTGMLRLKKRVRTLYQTTEYGRL
jgi:hypothetical protein